MNPRLLKLRLIARYHAGVVLKAIGLAFRVAGMVLLTLLAPIGFREVLLFAGAALIGYGLWPVYPPAAFIAPGVIISYVALFGVA